MKTKYFKHTLKGEHSAESAQRALGAAAQQGLVVRIDNIAGQAHVYVAAQGASAAADAKKAAAHGAAEAVEVSELDVVKIA